MFHTDGHEVLKPISALEVYLLTSVTERTEWSDMMYV